MEWAGSGDVEVVFAPLRVVILCDVSRTLNCAVERTLADAGDCPLFAFARGRVVCALGIWEVEVAADQSIHRLTSAVGC